MCVAGTLMKLKFLIYYLLVDVVVSLEEAITPEG